MGSIKNDKNSSQSADSLTPSVVDADPVEEFDELTPDRPAPPTLFQVVGIFFREIATTSLRALRWSVTTTWAYLTHHPTHALFNIIILAALGLVVMTGARLHDKMILSEISDTTVDKVIEASRFTREHNSQSVAKRGVAEFLRVGAPVWTQREAIRAVLYNARKAGLPVIDQAVLLATVEIESGFNPMARAPTTTACGLFQFVQKTGMRFGLMPEECMDPWKNADAGIRHYIENYKNRVETKVSDLSGPRQVLLTFEESYYLHHDGPRSSNPSPEVRALVLGGSQFLFEAYGILLEEASEHQGAPTFAARFQDSFWEVVDVVANSTVKTANALFTDSTEQQLVVPAAVLPSDKEEYELAEEIDEVMTPPTAEAKESSGHAKLIVADKKK